MSRAKTPAAPLDAHGQRVEPEQLYEAVDGFCTEVAPGVEFSASRGTTALGSTDVVQRCPSRFKRAGSVSPPPAYTMAEVWQPAAPPPRRDPRTLRICTRQVTAPSAGMFRVIYVGEAVAADDPVVADMAEAFRPLTPEEIVEHEAAR